MRRTLDAVDKRILDELQADGRLSMVELASRVHLTKTPCTDRVRRLEQTGVISGYHATLNPLRVGMNHVTIVHVNLTRTNDDWLTLFSEAAKAIPEVQSCLMIAGPFDYMLKVRTRDMMHFRMVLGERISTLPGVSQTHSFAVMESVKESDEIRLSDDSHHRQSS